MSEEKYGPGDAGGTEVLAFARYPDLERAADRTAAKIKEGFMEMGYILKVARDTDILAGSGYGSHEEFAEKRYGLDKGTVSRYIRIVERFSVGGNSHVLQKNYQNIGFAKLSLMLHMPDAIAEEITENYSKQEVQEIKEEIDAERAVTDIEVAGEAPEEKDKPLLERALRQLCREKPELCRKIHTFLREASGAGAGGRLMDILAPQGDAIYMVRIPGTGRLMLSFSGDNASVTNVRSGDKERYTVEDVRRSLEEFEPEDGPEESCLREYGEPVEAPAPAAGVPQAGTEEEKKDSDSIPAPQKEKRRQSKVTKAAPPKKPAAPAVSTPAAPVQAEEPLPGQKELSDYPGVVPDDIPDAHYEEITGQEPVPAAGISEPVTAPEGGAGEQEVKPENMEISSAGEERTEAETTEGELAWMDVNRSLGYLAQWSAVWDYETVPEDVLSRAYHNAIDLAAAIEKLMDLKGVKNG